MVSRNSMMVLIFAAACCAGSVYAAGDEGGAPPPGGQGKGHRGGGMVKMILKHADDLKLTDDQKTKLEALAKPPADGDAKVDPAAIKTQVEAILTADQLAKLKELTKNMKGGGKGGEKGGDSEKGEKPGDADEKK